MKKFFIISFLALLGMTQAAAQDYEYVPLVREGVKWVCYSEIPKSTYTIKHFFTLEFKGDAVINGVTYKAMHYYSGEGIDPSNDTIPVYMREEGRVVYAIVPDGKTYEDCPIDCFGDSTINEDIMAGRVFVLYDFNDPIGFIMSKNPNFANDNLFTHPVMPQTIMLGDRSVKRYVFHKGRLSFCFIEGIGCDGLTQAYPLAYRDNTRLLRMCLRQVIENGKVIYSSEQLKVREDEVPELVREGVKWVNERVVIEHGDTIRSYYTYEFKGEDDNQNLICHYYEGDSIDCENDSVIAKMRGVYFLINRALSSGQNMVWYSNQLYAFGGESVLSPANPIMFYTMYQKGDDLTLDNFVEVEPVWIEGLKCRRYAYYGDGDEPLCYVVEGIGFDSRDMGDLLTPFTRKPDPDADYQEYWGLSHVIKDGKIIYKGMCYNNYAPGIPGDANGDMVVNVADVTTIIDFLLNSFHVTISSYDVNLDGLVNIADVTSLIEMLLAYDESSINLHDKSNNPTRDESVNDQPYVFYKNDTHCIIIYGTKAVDYYDVVITSVATGASMISTWVDGSYGAIDVSTLPVGKYRITINSPAWGDFEGYFEVR